MCPFVVTVGGWDPAAKSFQWEYSKFNLFQQRKVCWIVPGAQRDSVCLGAGRFVAGNTALFFWAQKASEQSQGVIEAGS